ncbi:dimethylarginine dimethylaminohydrolase family protein [Aliamphritea ceti]|uniref:dimethylarginine dimethylaminohydrolase family protein n=1 Tax=Aliamphritea ceti TaxID=1524258 RepID=UPI0021C3D8A9|nr:arginine deiminase family protein [Aliamphritea ceti]
MFTRAIVKPPCAAMINGLTGSDLGSPNYDNALRQHSEYVAALKSCGLDIISLPADENFPDSTFVEDVALMTPDCAILTRPGAESRTDEVTSMAPVIEDLYEAVESIKAPGEVEAGDIMMVGQHFYIGLSARTNQNGAEQMIAILEKYGMSGSIVSFEEVLHLKTGLGYLEDNNLLASGEFLSKPEFQQYNIIEVPQDESYAANSIWVNGTVITPAGYPKTKALIEAAGYPVICVDVSEFRKIDGGLSCLSLRF